MGDARCVERVQCLGQTVVAPVEDVVVREAAAVDARHGDAVDVVRMHAVVDLLVAPVVLAGRDTRLEIDDAQIYAGTIEFCQRTAPDVIGLYRPRDRAVEPLGEFHVGAGALIDTKSDRILGFTVFGVEAGEIMASVQIAMLAGLPYTALRDDILTHPTLAEGLIPLFSSVPPISKSVESRA